MVSAMGIDYLQYQCSMVRLVHYVVFGAEEAYAPWLASYDGIASLVGVLGHFTVHIGCALRVPSVG